MIKKIRAYDRRPAFDAPGTSRFWDDPHIAAGMLENHLNPEGDGATRNRAFVDRSANWLLSLISKGSLLLDLGCGPGIYAEQFSEAGCAVTGIDLSPLSIDYAKRSAAEKRLPISYVQGSHLDMAYVATFDAAVLIYCDYGALDAESRARLLENAFTALKPGGQFILDVFTPSRYAGRKEQKTWHSADAGFWRPAPYFCLESFYRFDTQNAFLQQYIVAEEGGVDCYRIWDQTFTGDTLAQELEAAGFGSFSWYGDIAGSGYDPVSPTLCAVCIKE